MKLSEIEEVKSEHRRQIFHCEDLAGAHYTFVVRKFGVDGSNRDVFLGKMRKDGEPTVDVAFVVRLASPSIIAYNVAAPLAAAHSAVTSKQRAYGGSSTPERNWVTWTFDETTPLRGYDAAD